MSWWTEWIVLVLIASVISMLFKGGWILIIFIWLIYLGNGINQVEDIKKIVGENPQNEKELNNHILIGLVVILVSIIINLIVS